VPATGQPGVGGTISSKGSSVTVDATGQASTAAVAGVGPLVTEKRTLAPWRHVMVDGPFEVTITRGDSAEATLQAQKNLLPMVRTSVQGDTLRIFHTGSFQSRMPLRLSLATPTLSSVNMAGSGQLLVLDVSVPHLAVTMLGSGSLGLAGQADSLALNVEGAGRVDAAQLQTHTTSVRLTGSGNASVSARSMVEIASTGSGQVIVSGHPPQRHVDVRGAGNVTFR
jgi:hypothetical protein